MEALDKINKLPLNPMIEPRQPVRFLKSPAHTEKLYKRRYGWHEQDLA